MNRKLLAHLFWLIMLALNAPVTVAEETTEFPYTATVGADDVYVRSGPGKNYYPTQKMHRGEQVEVYRHDPGGWYAVRPPQDSFSWAAAKHFQVREDGVAEALEDNVAVLVGSLFSDVRDVRQIRLKKGELVEVLGKKRFVDETAGTTTTWLQLAPPAGEFRWVYGKLVSPRHATTASQVPAPLGKKEPESDARADRQRMIAERFGIDVESVKSEETAGAKEIVILADVNADQAEIAIAAKDRPATPTSQVEEQAKADTQREPANIQQVGWQVPGDFRKQQVQVAASETRSDTIATSVARVVVPVPVARVTAAGTMSDNDMSLDEQLEEISQRLSRMVAEEPTVWHFDDVETELEQLSQQQTTALQRGRARRLAEEIAEYETIRQRYAEIATIQSSTDRANVRLERGRSLDDESQVRQVQYESLKSDEEPVRISRGLQIVEPSQFDGSGRLAPVKSRLPGAPPYALIDATGEVQMFVSPEPGVQLGDYVGKQIGLNGRRGFMPHLKMPHMTAQRVKVLSE